MICAHPDDAEISCGGTLAKHGALGFKTGIVDLTHGEMATRGTRELRDSEAEASGQVLKLSARENLEMTDGWLENSKESQLKVIGALRKFRPRVVITNALWDRHPDHAVAASLVEASCFRSGLNMLHTEDVKGDRQQPFRPERLLFMIQNNAVDVNLLVDISGYFDIKMKAIGCFKSQFYNPESREPQTLISSSGYLEAVTARSREYGHRIHVEHAEGFYQKTTLGVGSLFDLI